MDPIETWHDAPEFERMQAKINTLESQLSEFSSATPSYVKGLTERIAELEAEVARLREIMKSILEFDPVEVCKDSFAYDRLKVAYRDAAEQALEASDET